MSGNVFMRFQSPSENKLSESMLLISVDLSLLTFYLLILFGADLSYICSSTWSSTVFFSSVPADSSRRSPSLAPSAALPADIPVKIHLLTGPSLGLLPSAINHGVIHPPLAPLVKWGHWPFRHAASEECGMRQTRHTQMEIYPQTLQKQHGWSDGGGLIHPSFICHF